MFITVQKAMELPTMSRATLVAGANGILNSIRSVTVLEIPEGEVFLEPGLLALTSFYAIANDLDAQIRTINLLCKHHAAGLLIFNVGMENTLPEISDKLRKLCDIKKLPLFKLPNDISYYKIIYEIMCFLLTPESESCDADISFYDTYANQLLYISNSISALLSIFSQTIHHEVAFLDHNHKCIFPKNGIIANTSCSYLQANLRPYIKKHDEAYIITIDASPFYIIPVIGQSLYCGSIVIANIEDPTSPNYQLIINQTKKVLYNFFYNSNRLYMCHEKQNSKFFMNILDGKYLDTQKLIFQANKLNLKIESVTGILVACLRKTNADCGLSSDSKRSHNDYYSRIRQFFIDDYIINLPEQKQIVVLTSKENAANKYLPYFSRLFLSKLPVNEKLIMGIGPTCVNPAFIRQCYYKAVSAIKLRSLLHINDLVVSYNDLETYDIIYNTLNYEQAQAICTSLLSPVRAYDEKHNSQLEETFSRLLIEHMSTAQVAEDLFLHKNTVLQRKTKIRSLYPYDPFSPTWMLQFEIAFLLKNMYGA